MTTEPREGKSFAPLAEYLAVRVQPNSDDAVGDPFRDKQYDLRSDQMSTKARRSVVAVQENAVALLSSLCENTHGTRIR